jgi:DNA invertase Pin-like site-specific DNA recombinase
LEAQRAAVEGYLAGRPLVAEFVEVESGRKVTRPMLAEALALCRAHRATLVIAKLDRLARNVAFVSNLMESGVEFTAVDFPQANRLTIHILAAVAKHEREIISARTKAALAAAKARGVQLGGYRGRPGTRAECEVATAEWQRITDERALALVPILDRLDPRGQLSLRRLAAILEAEGIPTTGGRGVWDANAAQRLRRRLAALQAHAPRRAA